MATTKITGNVSARANISSNIILEKGKTAQQLATAHSRVAPSIQEIYYLTSAADAAPQEPVKLLEVSGSTIEAGIQPVLFSATPTIRFPSMIVEITPREFREIKSRSKKLPHGWQLGKSLFRRHHRTGGRSR